MQVNDKNNELSAIQLSREEPLSETQYREIAGLIYDTDKYIFPALFEGNEDSGKAAEDAISYVLGHGMDSMYNLDNLFVCFDGLCIVGMILWCFGELIWNYEDFIESAARIGVNLIYDNVVAVNEAFFEKKDKDTKPQIIDNSGINLINVCVSQSCRGRGVGSFMLKEFVSLYGKNNMGLCVLQNNKRALNLYKANGFRIINEYPGFSQTTVKPMCYGMYREAD